MVASAPGKLILMGEHAAVYDRPALVAAVGLRARAELEPLGASAGGAVELELPDLDFRESTTRERLVGIARVAREIWSEFAADPSPERFARLGSGDAGQLVRLAVGEALIDLGPEGVAALPPFRLRVSSEIPIGAGFGSSAALSVGIVAAVLAAAEGAAPTDRVGRLALEVERRQHGLPSGVDHGTVLRGGVVWAERDGSGELRLEDLHLGNDLLSRIDVYHTGEPADTTGTVVAAVRELRQVDPGAFDARLDRMSDNVHALRRLLVASRADEASAVARVRDYQRCLEEIGVVPGAVAEAVRSVERAGAAAKISGAGTLHGAGAGCLLVLASGGTEDLDRLRSYTPYPVELGSSGLQLEICE